MGLFTDYLDAKGITNRYVRRVFEHIDSTHDRDAGGGPVGFYKDVFDAAVGGALGLPGELGQMLGGDIAGKEIGALLNLPGARSNPANNALAVAYATGGPGAALEAARSDPRKAVSYATGGLQFLQDPTLALSVVAGGLAGSGRGGALAKLADAALNAPGDIAGAAIGAAARPVTTPVKEFVQRQVVDEIGPLVKKLKPQTARDLLPRTVGGPLRPDVVPSEADPQKIKKLVRQVIEGDPLKTPPPLARDLAGEGQTDFRVRLPRQKIDLGTADLLAPTPPGGGAAEAAIKKTRKKAAAQAAPLAAPVAADAPATAVGLLGTSAAAIAGGAAPARGLMDRLRDIYGTYGTGIAGRKRLANLTGGISYLDPQGRLVGPAGDATDILDEYMAARSTLKAAGDQAALDEIKGRLRQTLHGGASPEEIAAFNEQVRRGVFPELFGAAEQAAPIDRAAWQREYASKSQAGTDILSPDVAGSGVSQADLNALSPQERMAALRKMVGGDIAAGGGGGGMGIVSPGGKALAGLANMPVKSGAVIGGLAGGTMAQDQNGDGNVGVGERLGGIAEGAVAGALGGAAFGAAGSPLVRDTLALGNQAGKRTFGEALQSGKPTVKKLFTDWKENTLNILPVGRANMLDALEGTIKSVVNDIPLAQVKKNAAELAATSRAEGTGHVAHVTSGVKDIFAAVGRNVEDYDIPTLTGQGAFQSKGADGKEMLHPLQSAVSGAAYGILDWKNAAVPVAGPVIGAVRGAARPYTSGFSRAVSDVTQNALRLTALEQGAAGILADVGDRFLAQLAQGGADVSRLAAKGGRFSPEEVANVAGLDAANVWKATLDKVLGVSKEEAAAAAKEAKKAGLPAPKLPEGLAGRYVKDIFGDYSGDPKGLQRALDAVAVFSRYATGQFKPLLRLVENNPGALLVAANLLNKSRLAVKENNEPAYNTGTLPVNGLPIFGAVAEAGLGGAPGTGRVNLASLVSPVGTGEAFSAADKLASGKARTAYDYADALLGLAGFGASPLIEAGAYLTGQASDAPRAASRTAAIEQAAGGPKIATTKGLADNVRKAISGKYPDDYNPVESRLREIVLRATGKPLSDPANHKLAVELAQNPDHPLHQQAEAEVLGGGAVKNAFSVVSPLTVSTQTSVSQGVREAKANAVPVYSQEEIDAAKQVSGTVAQKMIAANKAANPGTTVYDDPALSARETMDPRLRDWENRHQGLKSVAPAVYARERAAFIRANKIKE